MKCPVCESESVYFFNWWKLALFVSLFTVLSIIGLLIALFLNSKLPNHKCSNGHKFISYKNLSGKVVTKVT